MIISVEKIRCNMATALETRQLLTKYLGWVRVDCLEHTSYASSASLNVAEIRADVREFGLPQQRSRR